MKDEWVTTALSDDSLVVELLFRLKHQSSSSSSEPPLAVVAKPTPVVNSLLSLPNGWGHRRSRSKPPPPPPPPTKTATASAAAEKLLDSSATTTSTTRCSPTTPLSWCGGGGAASPSDGVYDDCSDSSRCLSFDPSRSKISYANEAATISCKRSRKKKTFSELKEEENFLLKERVNLTKELASMHVTIEEQKVRRENLKRIKLDLNNVQALPSRSNQMETSTSGEPACPSEQLPRNATLDECGSSCSSRVDKKVLDTAQQRGFILPDLNMIPSEEENTTAPRILYGIS